MQAYLTWRDPAAAAPPVRDPPRPPHTSPATPGTGSIAVAAFLSWLREHDLTLASCCQGDVETWLATSPAAYDVRDFLTWAADRKHCQKLRHPRPTTQDRHRDQPRPAVGTHQPPPARRHPRPHRPGRRLPAPPVRPAPVTDRRHDHQQIITRDGGVHVRFGEHEIPVPASLGRILTELTRTGRAHTGTGSPATSPWLFPGGMPGRPITPSRLGERLRAIGIRAMPGRRAALIDLAAQLPAAVLADTLNLSPGTAVRWMHQAGADWNRYAADLARSRDHQP